MPLPLVTEVAAGTHCIDTGLRRPGLAASYLVRAHGRLAFIDSGASNSVPRLLAALSAMSLDPAQVDFVIPTHVHLDHTGGAGLLLAQCPNARLLVHPKGAPHLIDPAKLSTGSQSQAVYGAEAFASDFGELVSVPTARIELAGDGITVGLAGRPLTFVHTPAMPTTTTASTTSGPAASSAATPSASPIRSSRVPEDGSSSPPLHRSPSTLTAGRRASTIS